MELGAAVNDVVYVAAEAMLVPMDPIVIRVEPESSDMPLATTKEEAGGITMVVVPGTMMETPYPGGTDDK